MVVGRIAVAMAALVLVAAGCGDSPGARRDARGQLDVPALVPDGSSSADSDAAQDGDAGTTVQDTAGDAGGQAGTGGGTGTGGATGSGGATGTAGASGAGGLVGGGGRPGTGGMAAGTGGRTGTGGSAPAGGSSGGGGASAGGAMATGGSIATGGMTATGGATATGGTTATGGATATGGVGGATPTTSCLDGRLLPNLCGVYCNSQKIYCLDGATGTNSQYASFLDCMTICSLPTWPCGGPTDRTGNTLYCRVYHLSTIATDPTRAAVECPLSGPDSTVCR